MHKIVSTLNWVDLPLSSWRRFDLAKPQVQVACRDFATSIQIKLKKKTFLYFLSTTVPLYTCNCRKVNKSETGGFIQPRTDKSTRHRFL